MSGAEPIAQGVSHPLGASIVAGGANFSVFAKRATAVELCLFDRADDATPSRVIELDARIHRSYHYWHAFVPGVAPGQHYGYRARGPIDPIKGRRFDCTETAARSVREGGRVAFAAQPRCRGATR